MAMIFQRVLIPTVMLVAGIVAVTSGTKYHSAPVAREQIEEQEREEEVTKTIQVPVPFGPGAGPSWQGFPPGPGGEPAPSDATPGTDPSETAPPGMQFMPQQVTVWETVMRPVRVTQVVDVREPELIREITVGGIELRPDGLWRTYGPDDPPPSLCPS